MELKQYQIHRKYKKCEAKNQITIGNDFGVPESESGRVYVDDLVAELTEAMEE